MWKDQFQTEGELCSGKNCYVQIRSRVPQGPNEADVPRYSGNADSSPFLVELPMLACEWGAACGHMSMTNCQAK